MKIICMKKYYLLQLIFLFSFTFVQAQITSVPTENDFETELIKPVQVIKVGKGHYFIDFGKAYFTF